MEGSIDRIYIREHGYVIGGWAFRIKENNREAANFTYENGKELKFTRVARGDCANGVDVGFEYELEVSELFSLVTQKSNIVAMIDNEKMILPLWKELEIKIKKIIIDLIISHTDDNELTPYINSYIEKLIGSKQNSATESSLINATVGSLSIDSNTIIGRKGNLFLFAGSNNVHNQYIEKANEKVLRSWVETIKSRDRECTKQNINFLQIIIPEKQTVYPEDYPYNIPAKTDLFQSLSTQLAGSKFYIDITDNLINCKARNLSPFKKFDTHYSIHGTIETLKTVLQRFGTNIITDNGATFNKIIKGDLGEKFFINGGLTENVEIPLFNYVIGAAENIEETHTVNVPGHIGTERSWRNPTPLIDYTVTIFGNSFFERGHDPLGLSYWFARIFREVHFFWTPDFDIKIAIEKKSNIVICQTIERFLKYLPKA